MIQQKVHMSIATLALVMLAISPFRASGAEPSLSLFGVALKNSTQVQLREAFKKKGLKLEDTQGDASFGYIDTYDGSGTLDGASNFSVVYLAVSKDATKFTYAGYKFPSHVDPQQVKKVIDMVSTKYGSPSHVAGNYELGPVTATWDMKENMQIVVTRGWPDTTTYLQYRDMDVAPTFDERVNAALQAEQKANAKKQSNAF